MGIEILVPGYASVYSTRSEFGKGVRCRLKLRISVPHHSFGRSQRAKLPYKRQPKRRTRGRSRLRWYVVETQEDKRGTTLESPCGAHLALSAQMSHSAAYSNAEQAVLSSSQVG